MLLVSIKQILPFKKIMTQGEELKKSTDLNTVKAIESWIRKNIEYKFYYNWNAGSGDITKLDKTIFTKRWNSKSGNCVFCAWLFYVMAQGAGVTVEIWNGDATFNSGKTYGHLWNKYKGKTYDGVNQARTYKPKKKIK